MYRAASIRFTSFLIFLTLAAASGPATAVEPGQPLWTFQGIEDINTFAWLPDQDGDGVPEVAIATYDAGADGDFIWVISGASTDTPTVLWSDRPSSGVSGSGTYGDACLTVSDDLNGDGYPDLLVSTAWGSRSVIAMDGDTGAVLWNFDTYLEPESGWIYQSTTIADRTGDGVPEVAFGVGSNNENGYLVDGADGSLLWRYTAPTDGVMATLALPDIDDDEVQDVLFCAGDNDYYVYAVSGAGAAVPATRWTANSGGSNYCAVLGDDVNGDGLADPVIGTWRQNEQVRCLDAADGSLLWTFTNGNYNYIMRLAMVSDIDDDGVRDLAVGSWERALRVISGADGTLIWESWAGTTNGGDFWTVDAVPDVTGDGLDEVVGGSFDKNVYLFNGANGDTLWAYNTGYRLYSVRGVPDLSGTGGGDVMGGTQYLSSGGLAYALEGGEGTTPVPGDLFPAGSADFVPGQGPVVSVRWSLGENLPCHVYRSSESVAKVVWKSNTAKAFAKGEIGQIEALRQIMAAPEAELVRVNDEPIAPSHLDDGRWCYGLEDPLPAGEPGATEYLITVELEPGVETTVLRLTPQARTTPRPVLLSATLHPNPFNPATWISFELDRAADVAIAVHDVRGRCVATPQLGQMEAGLHTWRWTARDSDGRDLPSGVYLLRLTAGGDGRELRAVLVR